MPVYELPGSRKDVTTLNHEVGLGQIPYGLHVPYDQGYDARSRANLPRAEDKGSSGNFFSWTLGSQIELWISDIKADFSLSGQTGQSRMVREFFPRSFNDVTLNITGHVASTQEYNRLAGFIRHSHWRALQAINQGASADQTIRFTLYNTYGHSQSWPQPSLRTTDAALAGEGASRGLSTVKGPHRPWTVSGYVKSIAAGAVHGETAPEFNISFIVMDSELSPSTGLWSDKVIPPSKAPILKTFLEILNLSKKTDRIAGAGFVQDPIVTPIAQDPTVQSATQKLGQVLSWSADAGQQVLGNISI